MDSLPVNEDARIVAATIRTIPDFPKPGIQFRDITPLLADGPAFRTAIDHFAALVEREGWRPDVLVSPEARGFIFGAALAYRLGIGFIPVRKPNKLPHTTRSVEYDLEYGTDIMEMHIDALQPGQRVILIDDLLATGGTMGACSELIREHGITVEAALFLIELDGLDGRSKLAPVPTYAMLNYPA